jgi:hypothetical protein
MTPSGRVETVTKHRRAVSIGSAARYIERSIVLDAFAEQMRTMITRATTEKYVACIEGVSAMLGWVAWDERNLLYVYTIEKARRMGVASSLLRFAGREIGKPTPLACMTLGGAALLNSQSEKWWL